MTEEKIRSLLKKIGIAPFEILRKNEAVFRELGLTAETEPGEIIKLIVRHPNLLQRPILEIGDKAVLAHPIEKAIDLINSEKSV